MKPTTAPETTEQLFSSSQNHSFFKSLSHLPTYSNSVRSEDWMGIKIERIFDPLNTCAPIKDELISTINSVIKRSLCNNGFEEDFIEKQLTITQEVIFIRDRNNGNISHYLRLDIYREIPGQPIGLAMYRAADVPSEGIASKITTKLMFEILQSRKKPEDSDANFILVGRTFSPKLYQMRTHLGTTYPSIEQFKKNIDAYIQNHITHFALKGDFTEVFQNLIRDEIILLYGNPIKIDPDEDEYEFILKNRNNFSFNLRNILLLTENRYSKYSVIHEMYENIRKIYINCIPSNYHNMMQKLMQISYPFKEHHDFDWCISKKTSLPLETVDNIEQSKLKDINDFFSGFIRKEDEALMFFCTELTYKQLQLKLSMIEEANATKSLKK